MFGLDVEFDENCDPNNPRVIQFEDIVAATERIEGSVIKTPCERAKMSEKYGMEVYLKQEFLQHSGWYLAKNLSLKRNLLPSKKAKSHFKERGVRNTLLQLTDAQRKRGVITATIGNHGIALSYQCSLLGIPCTLVMPEGVAINKSNKCLGFGAKVIYFGDSFQEAKTQAMTISDDKRIAYINGFDHPHIIEGQGSLGIEILEQIPDADAIMIPCGGGSLLAGVAVAAKHLKPEIEIYGVETNKTCSMRETLRLNERIYYEIDSTIADSLTINKVGVNTVHNIKDNVTKMVVVQEDWVARAVMHIMDEEKLVVESGAAVSVAAIMAGQMDHLRNKKVVCIMTGGNFDSTVLIRVLQRGMAAEGRLVKFKIMLQDKPGEIAMVCAYLAKVGVILRDCVPKRTWFRGDVFSLELHIIVETRNWDHATELVIMLRKNFKHCHFLQLDDRAFKTGTLRSTCLQPNPLCMYKVLEEQEKQRALLEQEELKKAPKEVKQEEPEETQEEN